MKKFFTINLIILVTLLSSCDKSGLREKEDLDIIHNSTAKRIDRIDFEISMQSFDFDDHSELRGNKIRLKNKDFDKAPYISVSREDIDANGLKAWVVGHGTRDHLGCTRDLSDEPLSSTPQTGYRITTKADGTQNIFIGFFDRNQRRDAFFEGQYVTMYFNGDKNVYRQQFDRPNENICLVKNGQITKREIPLITDFIRLDLSQKDGNGGGSPNTGHIKANFKPKGVLIGMSLENQTDFEIEVQGIKMLQPYALGYRGFLENADIEGDSLMNGAGTTFTDYSYPVPFIPEHINDVYEYPLYSAPESSDFLHLATGEITDGRFYVWGYPLKNKETKPVVVQIKYKKVGDPENKIYYSVPQKIDPHSHGKVWASGKAYRCNLRVRHQFEYNKIFSNELMTELKTGISESEINKIPEKPIRDMALKMLNGTYEKEFRVSDYKLYPNPNIQARENKTWSYSLRDNPTGIEVKEGETLIVLVGDKHNVANTKLLVQNMDTPRENGFSHTKEYPLEKGLNRILIKEKGLVYIQYLSNNKILHTEPKLDVHFITGKVNGYFDSQDPNMQGKGAEILAKAEGKFFDLVGKYAHLTFPTKDYPRTNEGLLKLINTYDKLVENEMLFLGLFKYNRVQQNRMYFHPMYDYSAAYATAHHVSFGIGNSPFMMNPDAITQTDNWHLWMTAHEVGHMNQTEGFRWYGLGEVSNNLKSMYITHTIFKQPSRIERESIYACPNNNRYANAFNMILVPKKSQPESENGERLIPLWQLQLYFGDVLGRTPNLESDNNEDKGGFYPEVYEYLRTHQTLQGTGMQQTEFPFIVSKVAKYDMTDFFEKWGYLKAFDGPSYNNDYGGSSPVTITQQRVNEVKEKIKALAYPKFPDIPLEYITDRTVPCFKNNLHVVSGSPAHWDKTNPDVNVKRYITIDGWQNVVAYEIWSKPYGEEGAKLLYAGDGFDTANPNGTRARLNLYHTDHIFPGPQNINRYYFDIDQDVYLYAVDVDNTRKLVPFE